ncbi:histone-like nucleoid-structuring protein Lsr2 [Streptomyces microflavus]|uniref:histone-like nucleoid-structuring protein Lsr2 n=1 Tax=Streptomyces microflavus TaxID=1919 RepID=UPI003684F5B7
MAQKIVTIYIDDITGQEDEEAVTHTFALNGKTYEIDLGPKNFEKLEKALAPYVAAGRREGGSPRRKARAASSGSQQDTKAIRVWARKNGHEVNDRGRVPAHIIEAYNKAVG